MLALAGGSLAPLPALAQQSGGATGAPVQLGVPGTVAPDNTGSGNTSPDTGGQGGAAGQSSNSGGIVSSPLPPIAPPPDAAQPGGTQPDAAQPGTMQSSDMQGGAGVAPSPSTVASAPAAAPGLLDDQHQGLGARLWQGSSIVRLTELMPKLPAPVTQPSLRDLQLRLLLTQASGPGAVAGLDSLVPLRAERLHAMGFDTEAMMISKQLSGTNRASDPQEAVNKLWLSGDTDNACQQVDAQVGGSQGMDDYWRRALVFCQILRHQRDQATVGIDLLREQGGSDPKTKNFIAVASILTGDSKPQNLKAPITNPDPLLAAMMKQAQLKVDNIAGTNPGAILGTPVGPAAAAATARDGSKPLAARIKAAEYAFATGLLPADELTGLYLQVPAASGGALTGADTPEHRGQLYQQAQKGQMPDSRAPLIAQALREAMQRGDYFSVVPLYLPLLQQITPNPGLAWFAPDAARALIAAGNLDRAGFWLNLAQGALGNPDVARSVPGLRLLARIASIPSSSDPGMDPVADWRNRTGASDAAAQRLYGILAGLGDSVGSHAATAFASGNPEMGLAAQNGRRGETVLLALIGLGGRGLAQADGATLAQSLGALTAVRLQNEARRIGIEAAILAGL